MGKMKLAAAALSLATALSGCYVEYVKTRPKDLPRERHRPAVTLYENNLLVGAAVSGTSSEFLGGIDFNGRSYTAPDSSIPVALNFSLLFGRKSLTYDIGLAAGYEWNLSDSLSAEALLSPARFRFSDPTTTYIPRAGARVMLNHHLYAEGGVQPLIPVTRANERDTQVGYFAGAGFGF